MKNTSTLQRGRACLCCRKRKMKCDGLRPICTQCLKADRGSECQYHEKQHISRTQILQQKVAKLEARLRELESDPTGPSGVASSSAAPTLAPGPSNRQDDQDTIFLSAPASVSANSEWNLDLSILDESPSAAPLSSSSPLFDVPGIWPNNTILPQHYQIGGRATRPRFVTTNGNFSKYFWSIVISAPSTFTSVDYGAR